MWESCAIDLRVVLSFESASIAYLVVREQPAKVPPASSYCPITALENAFGFGPLRGDDWFDFDRACFVDETGGFLGDLFELFDLTLL